MLRGQATDKVRRFGHDRLAVFGLGADESVAQWRSVLRQLTIAGLVAVDASRFNALRLTEGARPVLRGEQTLRLRRAAERGFVLPEKSDAALLAPLDTPEDMTLLRKAAAFEDMLYAAAQSLGVHYVSHYLTELAGLLHSYYARHQVLLADDAPRTLARLALLRSGGQVVRNGLDVLGVSAPESM